MIFVRGGDSAIAEALAGLEAVYNIRRGEAMPLLGEKYLFCVGLIRQKQARLQDDEEAAETFMVNTVNVMRECDRLLDINSQARICVIGSESGFRGSFDGVYAAAKAGLHRYVETKRLEHPGQQLVCVAPSCVVDTAMHRARNVDGVAALERRRLAHPKQRWLTPVEVARMVHFLLEAGNDYTTNVVIRMNGGEHCA